MDILFLIVGMAAFLLLPVISLSYLFLRQKERKDQLLDIFTLPGILLAYLNYRGRDISLTRRETKEENIARQKKTFNDIFKSELSRPYGGLRLITAIFIASLFTALVVWFLLSGSIDLVLSVQTDVLSLPVKIALLGAYGRIIRLLLNGYETYSLEPADFYKMLFYYVLAIVAGSLFSVVFHDKSTAVALAFLVTVIPWRQAFNFIKARRPSLAAGEKAEESLSMLQGVHASVIYRLRELGIHTTQQLAYADPLVLLFRTNFQPKVLVDWMDQAVLYNYVTSGITGLRKCGIRTAGELAVIEKEDPLLADIAGVLGITLHEAMHLSVMLKADNQAALIREIRDVFKIEVV